MSSNEKFFIGARVLSEEDVKGVLPNYESVFEEIENIREVAKEYRTYDKNKRKAVLNRRQINNAITISGQRGTGKTSVLFTILDRLERQKEKNGDLLFEPIEPVTISQQGDIIGCILSLLNERMNLLFEDMKKEGRNLPDEVKNVYFKDCIFKKGNPLQESFDRLLEFYLYLDPQYRQLLVKNFTDLNSYVKKSSLVLSADTEFQGRFLAFLDMFIDHYKMLKGFDAEKEPLMYFVLDDIDLCPERSSQLLHMIIKYMKHPNVVCFLAGDMETMRYELQLDFIRKENIGGIITSDLAENQIDAKKKQDNYFELLYRRKEKLAEDTLIKVLPAPRRFYLNIWSDSTKPLFGNIILDNEKMNFGLLFHKIIELCGNEEDNDFFFFNLKNNQNVPITPAFSIFATRSRELWNIEISAIRLLKFLQSDEKKEESIISTKQNLLETILLSSSTLKKYLGEHLDSYIVFGVSGTKTTILPDNIKRVIRQTFNDSAGKCPFDRPICDVLHYLYFAYVLLGESYTDKCFIRDAFLEINIQKYHQEFLSYFADEDEEDEEYEEYEDDDFVIDFLSNMPFRFFTVFCTDFERQNVINLDEEYDRLGKVIGIIHNNIREYNEDDAHFNQLYKYTEDCQIWKKISDYYISHNIYAKMSKFIWSAPDFRHDRSDDILEERLAKEFDKLGVDYGSVNALYNNQRKIRELYKKFIDKKEEVLDDYGSGVIEQLCKKVRRGFLLKAENYLAEYKNLAKEHLHELLEECEASEVFSQDRIRLFLLLNLYVESDLYNESLYKVKEWLDNVQKDQPST